MIAPFTRGQNPVSVADEGERRMKSWFARIGFALLVLVLAGFIFLASWEPFAARSSAALPDRHYRAEIIRDEFGVPHIYGKTDADVAFGVAIAHAEDDFFTLQDVVAMSKGRYGAIAGEDGAAFGCGVEERHRFGPAAAMYRVAARERRRRQLRTSVLPDPVAAGAAAADAARQHP